HDNGVGFGIFVEEANRIRVAGAVDRIAADADASALAVATDGELINRLVSQGAAAADNAHAPWHRDVARHNADVALPRCDDPGAIGPDQPCLGCLAKGIFNNRHIANRNALRDAKDQFDSGIDRFKDRIGREWWWHEDD